MKILKYIILTLMTNNPSKKFSRYVVLMFAFLKVNKFITKQIKRKLYYDFHCDISQYCSIDDSVVFVHPVAVVIGSKAVIEKNVLSINVLHWDRILILITLCHILWRGPKLERVPRL